MVEIIKRGKVVMRGRNLAPILRYQRKRGVHVTSAKQSGNKLTVRYSDGAKAETHFADPKVLRGWVRNRQKYGVFP